MSTQSLARSLPRPWPASFAPRRAAQSVAYPVLVLGLVLAVLGYATALLVGALALRALVA